MLRICDRITPQFVDVSRAKLLPLIASAAAILSSSLAGAATIDWNAASGNWSLNTNWRNFTTNTTPASPPGSADTVHVRNAGTVTLNDNRSATSLFIGAARLVSSVDVALDGAMNWTGGTLGTSNFRVGVEHNGVVTQNGATAIISIPATGNFKLGDVGALQTGTGTYTLTNGSITIASGTTGNSGIDLINGTFNMKGGTISQPVSSPANIQRLFRIASRDNTTSSLNISGGTITAEGGLRVANNAGATGNVNINQIDGVTSVTLGGDVAMGRNAFGQGNFVMDAGTLTVGTSGGPTARLIAGDDGPGKITVNGGTINVFDALRLAKGTNAAGLVDNDSRILLKGGTINVRAFESRTDSPTNLETITSTFTVDGATFTQSGSTSQGMTIGQSGKVKFEVLSGAASAAFLQLGATVDSQATVALSGGTLTINGTTALGVNRNTVTGTPLFLPNIVAPTVTLTGGNLVVNSTGASTVWQTDFNNQGTNVTPQSGAAIQVSVGDSARTGNFSMSSGSLNIDLGTHAVTGADRFVMTFPGSTASLTGGTINLNYLGTYGSPVVGDSLLLARVPQTGSVTLNAPAVAINAPGADPNWRLDTVTVGTTNYDIRLVYIPEPASCVLAIMGLMVGMSGLRRRSSAA
jgi:hypothetical protein